MDRKKSEKLNFGPTVHGQKVQKMNFGLTVAGKKSPKIELWSHCEKGLWEKGLWEKGLLFHNVITFQVLCYNFSSCVSVLQSCQLLYYIFGIPLLQVKRDFPVLYSKSSFIPGRKAIPITNFSFFSSFLYITMSKIEIWSHCGQKKV